MNTSIDSWMDELLDATYKPKYVEQDSEAWENMRAGRFTSSEIFKIMQCGKREMTAQELAARPKKGAGSKTTLLPDPLKMSPAGTEYVYQKVAEVLTGQPKPNTYAYPLIFGKDQEPRAVEYFEKTYGIETITTGFHPYTDHAGGSPDRLIGDTEGLEVKCPFNSEHQIEYLMLTDMWDLKRAYPNFYYQCVSLLLFTGRKRWHFCTFDDRMINPKHKLTHLEISIESETVQEDINAINIAITGAVKLKLETLSLLNVPTS